ncbi:DMT family transporter [Halanaerobiaceae bacterium Z-7014]|uniref:DMT family transporter n=1 Tax=Halonatronomonas betaini TaxID=2778430 RepID=A0A931F7X3_9FIRM|nr:DMT family transporter [Halonatronomonas betaini]MBF8435943.1 DMT family transporter [Halonatronomonas betaini]
MINKSIEKRIYLILAAGILVISFAGVFVAMADAPAIIIAFYRMFFTIAVLTPVFIYRKDCRLELFFDRRPVIIGFFLAIHFILWVTAFEYTAVANAVIFIALQPLFTLLFERLWAKEDLRPGIYRGLFIAITGSIIVGAGDLNNLFASIRGDTLAIMAAFFAGLYLFSGRSLRKKLDYFPYIYTVYTYATAFLLIAVIFSGYSFTGYSQTNWLLFIGLALGPTVIGHSVLNLAVRYVPATLVSTTIIGEPVLTSLLAWILLGDKIPPLTIVGGTFIIYGLLYTMRRNKQNKKLANPK